MANPIGTYSASTSGLTSSGTNDFFQLRGLSGVRCEILEIRIFQTSTTTLAMYAIQIGRGTGGASGSTAPGEYEWDTAGRDTTSAATPHSNASAITNVGTLTLAYFAGWNILQEFVWLPTPKYPLILRASDHMSLSFITGANLSGLGCNVVWEEYGA